MPALPPSLGGGGGGSTFIATSAMLARKTGLASSTGSGGTGLGASDATVLADGGDGAVEMKFAAAVPSPEITSVSPPPGARASGAAP